MVMSAMEINYSVKCGDGFSWQAKTATLRRLLPFDQVREVVRPFLNDHIQLLPFVK